MYFQLQNHLIKYSTLINVVIRTIPSDLDEHVPMIQKILIGLMKSPLAAPVVVPLFINLKNCVFEDYLKHLGKLWMHLNSLQADTFMKTPYYIGLFIVAKFQLQFSL